MGFFHSFWFMKLQRYTEQHNGVKIKFRVISTIFRETTPSRHLTTTIALFLILISTIVCCVCFGVCVLTLANIEDCILRYLWCRHVVEGVTT